MKREGLGSDPSTVPSRLRSARLTSLVTISGVNGRAALGISALPGTVAKTVWYAAIGHGRATYNRVGVRLR